MSITNVETAAPSTRPRLPEELASSTPFLMKRLGFKLKDQSMAAYDKAGLHPYHHAVLAVLDEGTRETQGAIADALGYDRGQLVGWLDELEERGLVERRRDPSDRRRHLVRLTPEGKRALGRLRTLARGIEDEFLAPLDERERKQLHALLRRLAKHHMPPCSNGTVASTTSGG